MNTNEIKKQIATLGHYTISLCPEKIYINHQKSNKVICINRDDFTIGEVSDFNAVLNTKYYNVTQADSIIGIFNYDKNNKYLLVVSSSIIAAKFKEDYIYNINSINYIKINYQEKSPEEEKRMNNIRNFLSSKHFYYSNTYDISKSLESQDNNLDINNYLVNESLLNDFKKFHISKCFFSYLIYGYVGCKIDFDIMDMPGQNKKLDLIIIERNHKDYILFSEEIARQIRQIELLTVFKNDQKENCVFSTVIYVCNEIFYQNIKSEFNPYHPYIKKELDNYQKIICILNDIYITKKDNTFTDFIHKSNDLNNKVILVNQISKDWKPGLYFESNGNCMELISSYFQNVKYSQANIIWFIDINNNMVNRSYMNDKCFHAFIRIFWLAIQKQMNKLNWSINIGLFNEENKTNLNIKYRSIIDEYFKSLEMKKNLYDYKYRFLCQNVWEYCFNGSIYKSLKNSSVSPLNSKDSILSGCYANNIQNSFSKLNILCISWNVDDLPIEKNDYNINDLLTQNSLYNNKILPDIIFISLQKLVKLNNSNNEEDIKNLHKKRYALWANRIKSFIQNIYANIVYIPFKCIDYVGNCFISFIKYNLQPKIKYKDINFIKTEIDQGNKGDKGYTYLTFEYNGCNMSVSSVFLNSKSNNNNKRLQILKQILNTRINFGTKDGIGTLKDSKFFILLGDFNFRVELDYEPVKALISKNDYDQIINNDQFYKNKHLCNEFNLIGEGHILFNPTFKLRKDTNQYVDNKIPSYTDRIFYGKKNEIRNIYYGSINSINYSSHKPVVGAFEIIFSDTKASKMMLNKSAK